MHEDSLSSVLSDFARTMLTDFRIQAILDHLVKRIVDVLDVSGAGVTLIAPGMAPRYVAASDEAALRFERLQTSLGQGPCLTAYESGELVSVVDLAADDRYPEFAPAAVAAGLAAVFTFPLRHGDGRLGALDLYRGTPGELDPANLTAAQTLADVAAAYLLNAQAREQAIADAERYRKSSLHDPLTRLPNRLLLQQRLEHAAQRAHRSHSSCAVLFADLDRFKGVNDTYGHGVGDQLLVAVAERLTGLLRAGDTLARVSGDEFVVLCEDLAHVSDGALLAHRVRDAFRAPFVLPDRELRISASVGVSYAGPGEAVTAQLVVDADLAMYRAKREAGASRTARRREESPAHSDRQQRLEQDPVQGLAQDLRGALTRGAVGVAYQPIVRAADGLVVGVEALLRWTHPGRGAVPALTAVAVAEQSGLIAPVGAAVLARCCRDRVQWVTDHPGLPLDLSVNVSGRQVMQPGFAATVASILQATGMDPTALVLEVTEGIFIEDGERAVEVFADVKQLGVRLALDDFGTGYSSLGYLRRFPLDTIKIDRSFVSDLGTDPVAAGIVAAATRLAEVLGMSVTAEGVETEQQRREVAALGCAHAQGFLYARPMPGRSVRALLAASSGALHLP